MRSSVGEARPLAKGAVWARAAARFGAADAPLIDERQKVRTGCFAFAFTISIWIFRFSFFDSSELELFRSSVHRAFCFSYFPVLNGSRSAFLSSAS